MRNTQVRAGYFCHPPASEGCGACGVMSVRWCSYLLAHQGRWGAGEQG